MVKEFGLYDDTMLGSLIGFNIYKNNYLCLSVGRFITTNLFATIVMLGALVDTASHIGINPRE